MIKRILNYPITQWLLSGLIILGALICMFTPNYFLFKKGANFAIQIMLGYLLLSMLFLAMRQHKLMFTSIVCCAGLCMFLKNSSNAALKMPLQTSNKIIKTAHFNLSASDENYQSTLDAILQTDADVISVQEVTPDWKNVLTEGLGKNYPHSSTFIRMDPFGIAIFSKYELNNIDTFHFEKIPNIVASIRPPEYTEGIYFITSHTTPPLYTNALEKMRDHLEKISLYCNTINGPLITMGEYNAPPWWTEIQDLKYKSQLNDSRNSALQGLSDLFENPVDYILFSNHFKCVGFDNISTATGNHLGIHGTYQYKPDYIHVETATQEF